MRYIVIFFIILIASNVYSIETIDSMRYIHAKNTPDNLVLEKLVKYLIKGAKTDKKVVETFFYWIALNIRYDKELQKKVGVTSQDVSIDTVLLKKATICAGYSNLLYEMCKLAKIECAVIDGIAQNYLDEQIDSSNHSWNAVKIDNKWFLIDPTWGSGSFSLGSEVYEQKMEIQYLFADPKFLIIDHFPDEKKWQLLNKSITIKQFHSETWREKRFRKFNNLLDDEDYRNHLQIMQNNGWNN